jgi:hypothetical protein
MTSLSRDARIAGLLYLTLLAAPLRLIYIPTKLFVAGNATATVNNIAAHETPFRLGIVGDLFTGAMSIFLTLALYRLFKARLVVILGALMITPIYFLYTINDAAALLLARGADFLSVFEKSQCDALVMVFLRMHGQGILANEIFWGLWLFPFGLLVYRSQFLSRILGVWLMLNCFACLATSLTGMLWPQYEQRVSNWVFPVMLGELAIMLWLIIMGAKERPQDARGGRLDALSGFGTGGLDPPLKKKGDPQHGKERFKEPEHSRPSRRCLPLNDTYTSSSDDVITPYQPDISDNVGSVTLSLKRTSPFPSKSVFVRRVPWPSVDNHGSPIIFRSLSVRSTHLFDPISDHDYSFKLPLAKERDAHSLGRRSSSPVRYRAVPRANRTSPTLHTPNRSATSSTTAPESSGLATVAIFFAGAAPGAYALVSSPHHIAPRLGLLPPARNATQNCLAWWQRACRKLSY